MGSAGSRSAQPPLADGGGSATHTTQEAGLPCKKKKDEKRDGPSCSVAELGFLQSSVLSALWVPPVLIHDTSNAALFIGFRSSALDGVPSLSSSSCPLPFLPLRV